MAPIQLLLSTRTLPAGEPAKIDFTWIAKSAALIATET
jgi:hypothetical protein